MMMKTWIGMRMTTSSIEYCNNCGRPEHTDRLIEEFIDGDGEIIEIIVCDVYDKQEGSMWRKENAR